MEAQLAKEAHLRTRAGRQHERGASREQVAISETHLTHTHAHTHTHTRTHIFPLFTHPASFTETHHAGLGRFHPCVLFSTSLFALEVLGKQLVLALSLSHTQVWLKHCNRIRRITTLKDNKRHMWGGGGGTKQPATR